MERKKLEKKIKRIEKQIKKAQADTSSPLKTQILRDSHELMINWESTKLKLLIWDANKEDGDRIQLIINNEIILKDYETKNKQKKIKYRLLNGENIIKVKALNLGNYPPNTSQIQLIDSKTKYPIITQLKLGKVAIIKILTKE